MYKFFLFFKFQLCYTKVIFIKGIVCVYGGTFVFRKTNFPLLRPYH